jgi:hypothetical protein
VERENKKVSRALKKFCEGAYAVWNNVQLILNERISQRIESSEFALIFGRIFNGFKTFQIY